MAKSGRKKGGTPWNKGIKTGPQSDATKEKKKGRTPWNKGIKTGPQSEETKAKRSKSLMGHEVKAESRVKIGNAQRGKQVSLDTRRKLREANLGKKHKPETIEMMKVSGKIPWEDEEYRAGRMEYFDSDEYKQQQSERSLKRWEDEGYRAMQKSARLGKQAGENHPNWQGGVSKIPYPREHRAIKERIRAMDGNKRQNPECPNTEDDYNRALDVHHIDYDKLNNDENNLITLCQSCNIRAGHGDRTVWIEIYTSIAKNRKPN